MTFVNAGALGTLPGKRDETVARLTRRNDRLEELGCITYEVGTDDEEPDTVFVVELWDSSEAHQASLKEPDVMAAIAEARPLLNGHFGGFRSTSSAPHFTPDGYLRLAMAPDPLNPPPVPVVSPDRAETAVVPAAEG